MKKTDIRIPYFAPKEVRAVWGTWTCAMQQTWIAQNFPKPTGPKSRLLRKPEIVRTDIFIQGLEADEVEMIREALEKGLTPNGFEVEGNLVILRFDRDED